MCQQFVRPEKRVGGLGIKTYWHFSLELKLETNPQSQLQLQSLLLFAFIPIEECEFIVQRSGLWLVSFK